MPRSLVALLVICVSLLAYNDTQVSELSRSSYWHTLLHIRTNSQSDIADPKFFLSKPFSPEAELVTTLSELEGNNRDDMLCRFPARYKYLNEQLALNLTFTHCENLQLFLKDSRGESASVGFASPYLDSPMSFFGHTFIKIDKLDNIYFSQTFSFAAEVSKDDGFFTLARKGIGGGYTGKFVASPYFKLNEGYTMIEQRSLTEYRLNLSEEEIERMLWHFYEIYDMDVDYLFITENCSYELLWLLESARPGLNLRNEFTSYSIPYETINAMKRRGLVTKITTEPSVVERLQRTYFEMNGEEHGYFKTLKESTDKPATLASLAITEEQRSVLAYQLNGYYDMLFKRYNTVKADFKTVKKMPYIPPKERYEGEPKRSDNSKIELGYLHTDDSVGTAFRFAPILLNRTDDRNSNLTESTLEVLSFDVNYVDHKARLENIELFTVESLSKKFDFYSQPSWKIRLGADRRLEDKKLHDVLQLGLGMAYGTPDTIVYFLAQTSLYPSQLNAGLDFLTGVGWWIENVHIGVDFDIPLAYTEKEAKYSFEGYLLLPLLKDIDIKAILRKESYGFNLLYRF
ncbi:MAG: hypothetical protein QG565_1302 [Campylobacterota bacterium]|nr:hypothetical protein [Campylobacterota bacterium]MDQ1252766.1 hypothetical protein [Euryarchaeota archaeon]